MTNRGAIKSEVVKNYKDLGTSMVLASGYKT